MTDDERRKLEKLLDEADGWLAKYLTYPGLSQKELETAYSLRRYVAGSRIYTADPKARRSEVERV